MSVPVWLIPIIIRFGPSVLKTNMKNPGAPSPVKTLWEEWKKTHPQPGLPPNVSIPDSPIGPVGGVYIPPGSNPWGDIPEKTSPIILDFSGKGVKTTNISAETFFDFGGKKKSKNIEIYK